MQNAAASNPNTSNPNAAASNNSNPSGASSISSADKKEDFKRYLERTHVIEQLTRVLVGLYEEPERPQEAVEYICQNLGIPSNIDVEALQKENESLRAQVQKLTKQVEELNKKLQQQPAAASAAALGQSS